MTATTYIGLTFLDLILSAGFVFISGIISLGFRLGLERTLLLNSLRMVVQLGAIGFVLKFIFAQTSPLWTVALGLIMVLVAGREVMARQTVRLKGWWSYGLGTGTMLFTCLLATLFGVGVIIGPEPWYAPRYILPILGMMLGNTMTGISLGLDNLTTVVVREKSAIEARLALGETRTVSLGPTVRQALRTGMLPIINAMAASGIVALPGMMTGQILSGVDPVEATKYQLFIMFLIAGSTALGVCLAVISAAWFITDNRHRLRLDRLRASRLIGQ